MILAISGSLRRASVNSAALRAAASAAARDGVAVTITDVVRELPHFDPDLEGTPPDPVLRFRAACEAATGVLLAVPEYAFGIPGAFKNALDWTVGSTCLNRKPVTVLNVAPLGRGEAVRSALRLRDEGARRRRRLPLGPRPRRRPRPERGGRHSGDRREAADDRGRARTQVPLSAP